MKIFCCECKKEVDARLANGGEVYPHREDLHKLPFWVCDQCGNFVGCHYKTKNRTKPLGCIPNGEIKNARKEIHKIMDVLLKSGKFGRKVLYAKISEHLGREYHTAWIKDIDEARNIYIFIKSLF